MSLIVKDYNDELLYAPISRFFGIDDNEQRIIDSVKKDAFERCMFCFTHINNNKFNTNGIQPYHCVQYGMWLYFLSNTIFNRFKNVEEAINLCDKIFMINMSFTQMDIYYGHKMPDIFLPTHTSGSVFTPLSQIGNYFMFSHGCNIGLNVNPNTPPIIGEGVIMMGHAKIVGNCHVGDHVIFSANSYIKDMDIPSNSIVFGQYPNVVIKEDKKGMALEILNQRFMVR